MKKVIRASVNEDEFVPSTFDDEFVEDIINKIKIQIKQKFGRRFKKMEIDVDDIAFEGTRMQAEFIVYNNGSAKADEKFRFSAYSGYWDEDDFNQHINTSISSFVENLV